VALALLALDEAGRRQVPASSAGTSDPQVQGGLADLRAARNSWDRHRPLQRLLSGCPVRLHAQPVRVLPACVGDSSPRIELHCFFPDGESTDLDRVIYVSGTQATSRAAGRQHAGGGTLAERFADAVLAYNTGLSSL
jgi:hypothetical protein